MKKTVCLLLVLGLLFITTACGGTGTGNIVSMNSTDAFTFTVSSDNQNESKGESDMQDNSTKESSGTATYSNKTSSVANSSKKGSVSAANTSSSSNTVPAKSKVRATDQTVSFFGRTYEDNRYDAWFFNWTNSGFEVEFEGTKLTADFFSTQNLAQNKKPHIKVYVDDQPAKEMVIDKNGIFTLTSGLKHQKHKVKVVKINESMLNMLSVKTLETDSNGKFLPPPSLPTRKIEFIGDSITCGYGNIPPYNLPELTAEIEDGTQTYGYFLTEKFNTDSRFVCVSGAPVYRNYLGGIGDFFKRYAWNDYNDDVAYDFSSWTPDLVIVNLGTNDTGAQGSTTAEFLSGARKWLNFIREKYPKAKILWAYGAMNQDNVQRIQDTVKYFNDNGDKNIYFQKLTLMDGAIDGVGGGGHPTVATHKKLAEELEPIIKQIMGW